MPGDDIARAEYARRSTRCASDLTDREWELPSPFMPEARELGRPRTTDPCEVTNAILYVAATVCSWRDPPKDFPPVSTVQCDFDRWRDEDLWFAVYGALVMAARELEGERPRRRRA